MTRRPRTCRAFTLVEVVLALALGTLVVLGASSVIGMLNRGDTTLRDRFDQTHALAKGQIVFRRIFSTIVMSNEDKPASYIVQNARAATEEMRTRAAQEAAAGLELPPVRFQVQPDTRWDNYARGMTTGDGTPFTPQRIEIVVSQPPLVASLQAREVLENRDSGNIIRASLEVRPSRTRAGDFCWAVWWVPLIETELGWVPQTDDTGIVLGDKVMDGLRSIRWTVFDDRTRKQEYAAIWYEDLPAYVEVELTTTSGLYANWMFDISWFIGPDSPASTLPPEEEENSTGGGGGGGNAGGGVGGGGFGPGGGGGRRG
ncbi:MAG: prepilin-type N-terminal cleavage/methylation domain-containing protein, partial [Phycisphaerales bacterium]|nr:prepilin-type N-terminal cleavage/methylation domain-containing protein [Phycisphaerales bacterium]